MTDTDPPETTSIYNLLLFSDLNPIQTFNSNKFAVNAAATTADFTDSLYGPNPPKMLCFGGQKKEEDAICSEITAATLKQMVCQSESSSASSANNIGTNPNRKRNESSQNPVKVGVDLVNSVSASKRVKLEKPAAHAKTRTRPKPARKEKIGDRIVALQQLVSPFGKTDTASVLLEAYGYIKFLHDQIQVLSAPYLHLSKNQEGVEELRSRGLCTVPVAYMAELVSTNGADYWAPAGTESGSNIG